MPLSDFQINRTEVLHRGKPLVNVRGLNANDVGALVRDHLDDLQTVWGMLTPEGRKLLPDQVQVESLLFGLITKAPRTAAKMIAYASDEPDQIEKALLLPLPLQITILIEVVKLTFEDVGGPLEFASLLGLVMQNQMLLQTLDNTKSSLKAVTLQ